MPPRRRCAPVDGPTTTTPPGEAVAQLEELVAEAQRLFCQAAALSGPRLTQLAADEGLKTLKERHLQKTLKAALEEVAREVRPRPQVSPRLSHGLKREWPRLGNFDISLAWGGVEVFGELKCGEDNGTLSACGWDAAKEAFCLQHGVGAAMLLVAGAPRPRWAARELGIELFFDGEWDMADIRRRYAAGFRTWELDGYRPDYVLRRLRTVEVCRTDEFAIADRPWRIGISRVEPVNDERMDWVPLLAATGS